MKHSMRANRLCEELGSSRFYGAAEKDLRGARQHRTRWIVDERRMARTSEALFMHACPCGENVIVTDA